MTPKQAPAAAAIYTQNGIISAAEARQELGSTEQQRRDQDLTAYAVLGELMQRVPIGIRVGSWEIGVGSIRAQISGHRLSDHEIRGRVMLLAEQFDLGFSEYPLAGWPPKNRVSASGSYQDVDVRFWHLVTPCSCENCGAWL